MSNVDTSETSVYIGASSEETLNKNVAEMVQEGWKVASGIFNGGTDPDRQFCIVMSKKECT